MSWNTDKYYLYAICWGKIFNGLRLSVGVLCPSGRVPGVQTSLTRPDTISQSPWCTGPGPGLVIRREDEIIASDNNPSDTGHWGPGRGPRVETVCVRDINDPIDDWNLRNCDALDCLATEQTQSGHIVTLGDTLTLARPARGKTADAEHSWYQEDN